MSLYFTRFNRQDPGRHNIELSRPAVSPAAKPSDRVYDTHSTLQAGRCGVGVNDLLCCFCSPVFVFRKVHLNEFIRIPYQFFIRIMILVSGDYTFCICCLCYLIKHPIIFIRELPIIDRSISNGTIRANKKAILTVGCNHAACSVIVPSA